MTGPLKSFEMKRAEIKLINLRHAEENNIKKLFLRRMNNVSPDSQLKFVSFFQITKEF